MEEPIVPSSTIEVNINVHRPLFVPIFNFCTTILGLNPITIAIHMLLQSADIFKRMTNVTNEQLMEVVLQAALIIDKEMQEGKENKEVPN